MKILVDENVPYGRDAFETLGEVDTIAGRAITREMLMDTDLLVVRSITKVNAALLEGTPVRFVGTCTIGEDHIDKSYLAERGITFSSAPGCNANSVGQYITGALLHLAEKCALDLSALKLGIVGVGNVGSRVLKKASALGLTCVLNDPPLAEETGDPKYRPIEEILDCDIVTLHVPLIKKGPWPTWHLVDLDFLRWLKPGAFLINSSRGAVVDNRMLKKTLLEEQLRGAVLDVWEGEPDVDVELLEAVDIATPHIAGYSFDGKVNGTRQIYEAACAFLNTPPQWDPAPLLPEPETPEIAVDATQPYSLPEAVRAVYNIMDDDAAMRGLCRCAAEERPKYFDQLRKQYPRRREFFNTCVHFSNPTPQLEKQFAGVGFTCKDD